MIVLPFRSTTFPLLFGIVALGTPIAAQDEWPWDSDESHEEEWYDPVDWFDRDDIQERYEYDWYGEAVDTTRHAWGYLDHTYHPYGGRFDVYDFYDPYGPDRSLDDDDWVWSTQQNEFRPWVEVRTHVHPDRATGEQAQDRGEQRPRRDTQRQLRTVRGMVDSYSEADLRGQRQKHTVVRLELANGETRLVNLGPKNPLDRFGVERGDQVMIEGRPGHIGERSVLMATRVRFGERSTTIERDRAADASARRTEQQSRQLTTLRGAVDDWKKMQIGGQGRREHLFVRLTLENDEKAIVNFGPNTQMSDLDLERGSRVFVRGRNREINGRRILFARDVRVEREPIELDWSPSRERSEGARDRARPER